MEHYKKKLEDMGLLRRQVCLSHTHIHTLFYKSQPGVGTFPYLCHCFQNKLMEEKNTVLMQTNVSLEEELRKANAAKSQLETYKRQVGAGGHVVFMRHHVSERLSDRLLSEQVVELQNRLSEESKKADKMEFEYKRLKEKVDSLQKEKDVRTCNLDMSRCTNTFRISNISSLV